MENGISRGGLRKLMEIAGLDCLLCPVGFGSLSRWIRSLGLIEYNILSDRLFPDCVTRITKPEPKTLQRKKSPNSRCSRTALFQNNEAASRWCILLPCIWSTFFTQLCVVTQTEL